LFQTQPLLVAVSKTKPAEAIQHAYAAGSRHFGENYVQELVEKAAMPSLAPAALPELRWHLIGHLQTNKVKMVARIPNLAMVESVDSVKLANALDKACVAAVRPSPLPVLIQVNTSGEDSDGNL
jgi:pyridoxal phosphate enzyme (YggS family)